ncbi:MAG: hypothetical protein RDV00_00180 [Clostridia bacterium]|nr:hypothetical protein [Clostridia bacterium]
MRLPFWLGYPRRLSLFPSTMVDRPTRFVLIAWVGLVMVAALVLVPQYNYYRELENSVGIVNAEVASAAHAVTNPKRPAAVTTIEPEPVDKLAGCSLFTGASVEALNRLSHENRVAVSGYRPIKTTDSRASETGALELTLEGPYPGIRAVLRGLENDPFRAEVRRLVISSTDDGVRAEIVVVQIHNHAYAGPAVSPAMLATPDRIDIFKAYGRSETATLSDPEAESETTEVTTGSIPDEISYIMDEQ